jgi:RNA polymerase sigma factor (sigma-70 family)
MYSRLSFSTLTIAQRLQTLATQLQPVLRRWQQVVCDDSLPANERRELLHHLERQAQKANRSQFLQLIEKLCRSYCSRKKVGSHPGFDLELFIEEVKFLAMSRLSEYDPAYPFQCWFTSYILLPVYKSLGRSVVVTWESRVPKTEQGRFMRWQTLQLLSAQSMEGPAYASHHEDDYPTMAEIIPDHKGNPEDKVLNQQCRERFVQALQGLSETDQTLLTRIYLKNEMQKEVAQSVGITPGRISQKLKQIYDKLASELGEHFQDDCGQTSFCQGWCNEKTVGEAQAGGSATSAGCHAHLVQFIPQLIERSHWNGVILNPYTVDEADEESLLEELFKQPFTDRTILQRFGWTAPMAVAAAVMIVVWSAFEDRNEHQSKIASQKQVPPITQRTQQPTQPVTTKNPPPAKQPAKVRRPDTVQSSARKATVSVKPASRTDSTKKHHPQTPDLIATTPAHTPERHSQPTPIPEVITRAIPDGTPSILPARVYAEQFCARLNEVAPLSKQPRGFTLLEVLLVVHSGNVEFKEDATQVIVSSDPALDDVHKYLQILFQEDLPPWPQVTDTTARYYITIDPEKQNWTCQPVSE